MVHVGDKSHGLLMPTNRIKVGRFTNYNTFKREADRLYNLLNGRSKVAVTDCETLGTVALLQSYACKSPINLSFCNLYERVALYSLSDS